MIYRIVICLYLLCHAVVSFGQMSLHAVDSARNSFRHYCGTFPETVDYSQDKSVEKALWIISAFNRSGESACKFLDKLADAYDSLSLKQKYGLVSLLASRDIAERNTVLVKAMNDRNAKLSLLAYSILSSDSSFINGRVYDERWDSIKHFIERKEHETELDINRFREISSFVCSEYGEKFNIIVLARADRNLPVKILIANPGDDGFTGSGLFYLARSADNILSYFTNGNTPCGVYKIRERAFSDNVYIGPVETLVTELPFESDIRLWNGTCKSWSDEAYAEMLPLSLRDNSMLWQAFYAGAVGRSEIIVHGSTIDPLFFADECFFPLTPSLGCLSAFEMWNGADGTLLESHQQRLVDMLPADDRMLGFMYVLQVDSDTYSSY